MRTRLASFLVALLVIVGFPTPAAAEPRPDQCFDIFQLHDGRAERTRQAWFDHLDAKGYARYWIACVEGWGTDEWLCLEQLWQEESGWNHTIRSGIAQRMPESVIVREIGPDYRQRPRDQVINGVDYIDQRYGTPLRASFKGTPCHAGY